MAPRTPLWLSPSIPSLLRPASSRLCMYRSHDRYLLHNNPPPPPSWLKIHSAPAKFIRDGPGYCIVTGCLAAWTWQQTQTQQLVRHTPTVKDHSSLLLAYCAAIRRETGLYTKPLTRHQSKFCSQLHDKKFYFTFFYACRSYSSNVCFYLHGHIWAAPVTRWRVWHFDYFWSRLKWPLTNTHLNWTTALTYRKCTAWSYLRCFFA